VVCEEQRAALQLACAGGEHAESVGCAGSNRNSGKTENAATH
jgi:hypothetical protein